MREKISILLDKWKLLLLKQEMIIKTKKDIYLFWEKLMYTDHLNCQWTKEHSYMIQIHITLIKCSFSFQDDICMHLTNYAVNKHSKDFIRDEETGSKR